MSKQEPHYTARIVCAAKELGPERLDWGGGELVLFSIASPDKNGANEGAAAVIRCEDRLILAVADGVGGMPAGASASRLAIDTLEQRLSAACTDRLEAARDIVLDVFETVNQELLARGVGSSTTLAVAEIHFSTIATKSPTRPTQPGVFVRLYHVGDSGVLVTGQRGRIRLQTMAHSPTGYAVEAGLLDEADALQHKQRHILSNMLGAHDMHIQIGPRVAMARYDTLLLATDGLWDNFYPDEIVERVRRGSVSQAASNLGSGAGQRMLSSDGTTPRHPDDLTFILFRRAG
jgi:serine/threonine protein phosphatase PrpC